MIAAHPPHPPITHVDDQLKRTARLAGVLYLLMVVTGPFVLMYVPRKLFVMGDATATAANILSHQGLMQAHIAVGIISELAFLATVFALYELLKGVNWHLAATMAILVLIQAPVAFLGVANEVATLHFLREPGFMSALAKPQRDALALLFINYDSAGVLVAELFWGLWLFPLAALIYRSTFIPRFIGVWLAINGMTYVVLSAQRLMWPEVTGRAFTLATPFLLGEVALMLWLLIMGARPRTQQARLAFTGT